MRLKWTFYLFVTVSIQIVNSKKLPAICNDCDCKFNHKNNKFDIKCLKIWPDVNVIFKPKNWETSYQQFSVNEISIKNTNLSYLSQVFPLSNVETLDLAYNFISKSDRAVFRNLPNMKTLILSHNNISNVYSIKFCDKYNADVRDYQLRSLKSLYLDYNYIRSLEVDSFDNCSNIEYLSLSHNPLREINNKTLKAIKSLEHLRALHLSYTQIKTLPESIMLHSLNLVDISGNEIETIPRALIWAHNLTTLILSDNPIANLTKKNGFPRMESLKSLHMRNMPFMDFIGDGALSQLINLEELHLSGSNLVAISKNALSYREKGTKYDTWSPIKRFYLNNNKLTHLDQHVIGLWSELVELDLSDNLWTCDCQNQWMFDELLPVYLRVNETSAKQMKCAIDMRFFSFYELKEMDKSEYCYNRNEHRWQWNDMNLLIILFVAGSILIVSFLIYLCVRIYRVKNSLYFV